MLVVIGVAAGLAAGVWATCVWGLRKATGWPELLVVVLALTPVAYFSGAESWGWPTPRTIAESYGLGPETAGRVLLAGIELGTAVVVVAVLVRWGVTRRLERWSCGPG